MIRFLLLLLLLLLCRPVSGQDVYALDGRQLQPGRYYLSIDVAPGGALTIDTMRPLLIGEQPGPEDDPTQPDDPPSAPGSLTDQVERWARPINQPVVAGSLAVVYDQVAARLAANEISEREAELLIVRATDALAGDTWSAWRQQVAAALLELDRSDRLDLASAYDQISAGLAAAAGNQAIDTETLIKLLALLLELIRGWG